MHRKYGNIMNDNKESIIKILKLFSKSETQVWLPMYPQPPVTNIVSKNFLLNNTYLDYNI